jgi:hypothetical protein
MRKRPRTVEKTKSCTAKRRNLLASTFREFDRNFPPCVLWVVAAAMQGEEGDSVFYASLIKSPTSTSLQYRLHYP